MLGANKASPAHDSAAECRMYGRRLNMEHLAGAPSVLVGIVQAAQQKAPRGRCPAGRCLAMGSAHQKARPTNLGYLLPAWAESMARRTPLLAREQRQFVVLTALRGEVRL